MASSSSSVTALFLLVVFSIFAISATARPCKTIFFITSFSSNNIPNLQNPNSNSPHRLTFFITEIHRTTSVPIHHHNHPSFQNDVVPSSSIRDRTMDIMSIVGALLFGVGCGALTAATMYLIWSLISNRADDDDYVSDCSDDDEDDVSNKKVTYDGGEAYVAVPVKEVPPTADEVDAMK
uniref:uncharacterized protein LOC122578591 n=1 Tax=Erigeron canadensis TaxID=72917 RepID=UPI001CB9BC5A|nr:uncharacterized protein LOC122578591 [Erigeron canadensis]